MFSHISGMESSNRRGKACDLVLRQSYRFFGSYSARGVTLTMRLDLNLMTTCNYSKNFLCKRNKRRCRTVTSCSSSFSEKESLRKKLFERLQKAFVARESILLIRNRETSQSGILTLFTKCPAFGVADCAN